MIGISIGGGAPLCPCLYVVQVFDNTPAAKDATLQAGDEIVGVNGKSMRGKTKVDVAREIQSIKVFIHYFVAIHVKKIVLENKDPGASHIEHPCTELSSVVNWSPVLLCRVFPCHLVIMYLSFVLCQM